MDPHVSFTGLLVVALVAFAAPLVASAGPGRPFPSVVLLIVAGIVLGPSGLGVVTVDEPIRIVALLGLAVLLLLAVILIGTSLGIAIPIPSDAGLARGSLGQTVIAAGLVAAVVFAAVALRQLGAALSTASDLMVLAGESREMRT